jgi:MFS family permease
MRLFTEERERAKAMGVYSFVCAGGGSIGVLLGGVLTDAYDWHWVFLVNVPIGAAVLALCLTLLPAAGGERKRIPLDVAGAITVTAALMLAVYAIVGGNNAGWTSPRTIALLGAALALLALFVAIEARVPSPLMPLRLFRSTTLNAASVIGILWSGAMFAWFFLSALYLQRVLGYSPMQVGLAFLPSNLIMAACSLGISARIVLRFGIRWPLVAGLLCAALGLALFALAPVGGTLFADVLPGMLLLGVGAGIAFNPLLLAAMRDVGESESGLASGIVNTAFMMGGALGLAVLASLAAAHTGASAATELVALNAGYHLAFAAGALFALVAAAIGAAFIPGQATTGESSRVASASTNSPGTS